MIAKCSVADDDFDVGVSQTGKALARHFGQLWVTLNAKDVRDDLREKRGLISRAGSQLQHAILRTKLGCLKHRSDDVWLRNRLTTANRQRPIFVSMLAQLGRDELLARNFANCGEHALIEDSPSLELTLHHDDALEFEGHGSRVQGQGYRLQGSCTRGGSRWVLQHCDRIAGR